MYFRTSGETNDLTLLPQGQRDHQDIDAIAARAEAAVLSHFTKRRYDCEATVLDQGEVTERYVYLRGYAADPDEAVASLATALRAAIAEVIRWTIARDAKKPNITDESGDKKSQAYRGDAEDSLPPVSSGWDAPLLPFRISSSPIYL